ncbi:MAG: LysR family transcriptional regulator [Verrucomicrobiota bacterium]
MDKYKSLFDLGGLSLDRLRNFSLIAEAGGVSRAADGDPTRMSLFSKQVKELETYFGVKLTERQGRNMKLTQAGRTLADLAREQLIGLENFKRTCRGMSQKLVIASGNSILEWALIPRLTKAKTALPNTGVEILTGRTQDNIRRLSEMTVDLALVREDAVVKPLKSKRILRLTYSLFLPKKLAAGINGGNLKRTFASLPMATSIGGQFREELERLANRAGWDLKIDLACSSFTQAAGAVKTGEFGAILPSIAAVEFNPDTVVEFPLPFMNSYARTIALVWNPRLTEVRPLVAKAIEVLNREFGGA